MIPQMTFLDSFCNSREPFIIYGNRLYTFHRKDSKEILDNAESKSEIEESETINNLERIYFMQNIDFFEDRLKNIIKRWYDTNIGKEEQEIAYQESIFEEQGISSPQEFIIRYIFPFFTSTYSKNSELNNEKSNSNAKKNPSHISFPSIDDLISDSSSIFSSFGFPKNILCIDGKCHTFTQEMNLDSENNFISFNGKNYRSDYFLDLESFSQRYRQSIQKKINDIISSYAVYYSVYIEEIKDRREKQESHIQQSEKYKKIQGYSGKRLSFRKKDDNLFEIIMHITPFLLNKDNSFYHFKEVDINLDLRISKNNNIKLDSPPKISEEYSGYYHPFVFTNSNICYSDFKWTKEIGINFHNYYPMNEITAQKIAKVLSKAEQIIIHGYLDKELRPVHDIKRFPCIASSYQEAIHYAQSNNIPRWRIIKNER